MRTQRVSRLSETDEWRRIRAAVLARDGSRCTSCGIAVASADADIHHLVLRAAGGLDDPANLITLCDGCHAARQSPGLARAACARAMEPPPHLAHWLDRRGDIKSLNESLGTALRLLKVERFRSPQLEVVLAALRGESILLVSATGSDAQPLAARLRRVRLRDHRVETFLRLCGIRVFANSGRLASASLTLYRSSLGGRAQTLGRLRTPPSPMPTSHRPPFRR